MKFSFTSAALLALAVALVKADYATVKQDAADIDTAVASLNKQLASDDITYFSALNIDSSAKDLDKKIQTATSDANAVTEPVTDEEANELISMLSGTEKKTQYTSSRLVTLEPKFKSLGVAGLAKDDISSIQGDVKTFGSVLVSKSPSAEKQQAQDLADAFNADLSKAAAAYASD